MSSITEGYCAELIGTDVFVGAQFVCPSVEVYMGSLCLWGQRTLSSSGLSQTSAYPQGAQSLAGGWLTDPRTHKPWYSGES